MGSSIKMTFNREMLVSALFTFPPAQLRGNLHHTILLTTDCFHYLTTFGPKSQTGRIFMYTLDGIRACF